MYSHKEAFKVMSYACRGCGHVWVIWNARDGVAPFAMPSPCCGDEQAVHKDYLADRNAHSLPALADYVLVDMDETRARRIAQQIYNTGKQRFEERIEEGAYKSREDLLQQLADSFMGSDARPVRLSVADYTCGLAAS